MKLQCCENNVHVHGFAEINEKAAYAYQAISSVTVQWCATDKDHTPTH